MSEALTLPKRVDLEASAELASSLAEKRGGDLTIDASSVNQLGTPGLQVLLSAASTWAAEGHDLKLVSPSDSMLADLRTFGVDPSALTTGSRED